MDNKKSDQSYWWALLVVMFPVDKLDMSLRVYDDLKRGVSTRTREYGKFFILHCSGLSHYQWQYQRQCIGRKQMGEMYPCKMPLVLAMCAACSATIGFHLCTNSSRWSLGTFATRSANGFPFTSFMTTCLLSWWIYWPAAWRPLISSSFTFEPLE